MALLEEMCHWSQASRFQKTLHSKHILCLLEDKMYALSCFAGMDSPSETIRLVKLFSKLPWSWCFVTKIESQR